MLETENSWFKEEGLELGIDTVQGCLVLRALFKTSSAGHDCRHCGAAGRSGLLIYASIDFPASLTWF